MPSNVPNSASLMLPGSETALGGVNTPLGLVSIDGSESDEITLVVTASSGALFADTYLGAVVGGGGTGLLWIAGSLTQVNATLATLVYLGQQVGDSTLSFSLLGASSATSGPVQLPLQVLPLIVPGGPPSPAITIAGGTLSLEMRRVDGITFDIHDAQTGAGAATLVLVDSTLGAGTTLDVTTSDAAAAAPRVAIGGAVEFDGSTTFHGGPALITIADNAVLTNTGHIVFDGSTAQLSGAGTLENDGAIEVVGSSPAIDVAVTGTGTVSLDAGSHLTLAGMVAASQTVLFTSDSGVLELDAPSAFQATIAGLRPGDQIDLGELQIDATSYTQTGSGGTLTLYDGAAIAASLHFAGAYQLSDFAISVRTDSAGDGGAISTLSVLASSGTASADAAATTDVYRFFNTSSGTQLLTQDAAERDAVTAARPDLKFEGVAMHALAAPTAEPAAVAVARFFDLANGSYFYTADASEKATLLATRPDLVLEPSSTIWEDATQQAGDVPVFRFFDTSTGGHFFTASAAERASVLSTRPDLQPEGIAFYAPSN